jgi:hypothetical protein
LNPGDFYYTIRIHGDRATFAYSGYHYTDHPEEATDSNFDSGVYTLRIKNGKWRPTALEYVEMGDETVTRVSLE